MPEQLFFGACERNEIKEELELEGSAGVYSTECDSSGSAEIAQIMIVVHDASYSLDYHHDHPPERRRRVLQPRYDAIVHPEWMVAE